MVARPDMTKRLAWLATGMLIATLLAHSATYVVLSRRGYAQADNHPANDVQQNKTAVRHNLFPLLTPLPTGLSIRMTEATQDIQRLLLSRGPTQV
jgi:hypothetical protein